MQKTSFLYFFNCMQKNTPSEFEANTGRILLVIGKPGQGRGNFPCSNLLRFSVRKSQAAFLQETETANHLPLLSKCAPCQILLSHGVQESQRGAREKGLPLDPPLGQE